MTYKMTEEYQKILTEMIGECWHDDLKLNSDSRIERERKCPKCNKYLIYAFMDNRTFTTPDDMMKVFRWLVDNGKWEGFVISLSKRVPLALPCINCKRRKIDCITLDGFLCPHFTAWLFYNPERFCCLVAQAKKEVYMYDHDCWIWHTCDQEGNCQCLICGRKWHCEE